MIYVRTATSEGLEAAESAFQEALLSGNPTAVGDLIDANAVFVSPDGEEFNKSAQVALYEDGVLSLSTVRELSRSTMRFDKSGTTRVRLHMTGSYRGTDIESDFLFTRSWLFQEDSWRITQSQGILVPPHLSAEFISD